LEKAVLLFVSGIEYVTVRVRKGLRGKTKKGIS
jgi:hypothetical protein